MRSATIFCILLLFPSAQGFVVLNHRPDLDPFAELDLTPRFSAIRGTWLDDDVHGLDGGIEYVVAPGFCDALLHRVIDTDSCDVLLEAVQRGLDVWGDAHPFITFNRVNVTPDASGRYPGLHGIPELEIRAAPIEDRDAVAHASSQWFIDHPAISTSGQTSNATSLAGGFVEFDSDGSSCVYIEDRGSTRCGHFIRTLAHEVGHVLQLGHPDEPKVRYFDTNEDPLDPMVFDCITPAGNLTMPKAKTGRSIMNSVTGSSIGLSVDDQGGLEFLYPVCPGQTTPPWEQESAVETEGPDEVPVPVGTVVPVLGLIALLAVLARRR